MRGYVLVTACAAALLNSGSAHAQCPAGAMTSLFWSAPPSSRQAGLAVDMAALPSGELLVLSGDNYFGPMNFVFVGAGFVFKGTPSGPGTYTWSQEASLIDSGAVNGDQFGNSVAIFSPADGDTLALVASALDDAAGVNAGSVGAFVRSVGGAWTQETLLVAPDASAGDAFGYSTALAEDLALIGAPDDDAPGAPDSGSAYLFERVPSGMGFQWIMRTKLTAPDASTSSRFGRAVTLADEWAIVGAPFDDQGGNNAGAVYAFRRTPDGMGGFVWPFHSKLIAPGIVAQDQFGAAISVSAGVMVIGALFGGAGETGAGYVYRLEGGDTWIFESALSGAEATGGDQVGKAVVYRDGLALLGANEDDDNGTNAGSAYLFRRAIVAGSPTWSQASRIRLPVPTATDDFGFSVGLARGWMAIGSPAHNQYGTDKGNTFALAAPTSPVILAGPTDQALQSGESLSLSVDVGGKAPWTHQWFFGPAMLMNGGRISGADTATLTITDMQPEDAGTYRVEVTNSCGVSERSAEVSVAPPPHCSGDADGDGMVNFADVTSVLAHFGFDYQPGTGAGDADGDGLVNFADITSVLSNWGGACP